MPNKPFCPGGSMQIKKCHYCESSMPSHFPACPYCGRSQSLLRGILILILILTVVAAVYVKVKGKSSEDVPPPPALTKSEWPQPLESPQDMPGEQGIVPNAGIVSAKEMKQEKKQRSFDAVGGIDSKALDEALRSEKSFRGSTVPQGTE